MAVAAVDAFSPDVVSVAELDRLLDEHILVGVVSREVEQSDDTAENGGESDGGQDAQSGIDVRVAIEDLTHRVDVRAAFSKRLLETGGLQKTEILVCLRRNRAFAVTIARFPMM